MDKITYLAELAEGLARWVPERERQDILRYYAEYFEEAGPGREAEVVAELGDPWALSSRLAVEGGYVTPEKAASWRPKKVWPKVLLGTAVGLTVFSLVFGIGLLAFNVVRNVRYSVHDPALFGKAEQVTTVDWGLLPAGAEYDFAFVDESGAMGYYFLDGESVASFRSIDMDVGLGNIQVLAGDSFTLSITRSEAMSGYEPAWEVRDGVLRLRDGGGPQVQVNSWADLKKLFSVGQLTVDVTITVPEWTTLDRVSVKTGLGDVLLYGVNAVTVTAETGVGDVECCEARNVRTLELNTGVGNVFLDMENVSSGQSLNASLTSGTGNVEAYLGCSEKDCRYELESGLGLVTVNGAVRGSKAERTGNALYRLNAESGTGGVNVYFFG